MKKFFKDFKAFISRGNIVDMAIGVIVASAFTAIVTALTNQIIMPCINWLLALGGSGLDSTYTFLKTAYAEDNVTIDLANSIYIDWGTFITAILNFIIVAFVLFTLLRVFTRSSSMFKSSIEKSKKKVLTKEDKKELKARGVSLKDHEAVALYQKEKEDKEAAKKAEEEAKKKAEEEEKKKNSTEYLLKEIRDLLIENKALREAAAANTKEEVASKSNKKN